jgi:hypothetical protein
MSSPSHPEIILYDLSSTLHTCFSPTVWRIRLLLNYKHVPYQTVFLEFPDIQSTLTSLYVPLGLLPTQIIPDFFAGDSSHRLMEENIQSPPSIIYPVIPNS